MYPAQSPTEGPQHLPPLRILYRAEKTIARAIISPMPQGSRDPDWKDGVQGAAGSWKLDRVLFPENEMVKYNEA